MKTLKENGGVVNKGVTEYITIVWTKTMCTEVLKFQILLTSS